MPETPSPKAPPALEMLRELVGFIERQNKEIGRRHPILSVLLSAVSVLVAIALLVALAGVEPGAFHDYIVTLCLAVGLLTVVMLLLVKIGTRRASAPAENPMFLPAAHPPPTTSGLEAIVLQQMAIALANYNRSRALGQSILKIVLFLLFVYAGLLTIASLVPAYPEFGRGLVRLGLVKLTSTQCLLNPLTPCQILLDRQASALSGETPVPTIPTTQPTQTPQPEPTAGPRDASFKVFLQFAGTFTRSQVVEAAQSMASAGWNMQGSDRGGERTAASVGFNEVRYPQDIEGAADSAARLAAAVKATGLIGDRILAVKPSAIVKADTLEIWISN